MISHRKYKLDSRLIVVLKLADVITFASLSYTHKSCTCPHPREYVRRVFLEWNIAKVMVFGQIFGIWCQTTILFRHC
jgi:hypothetical protein